MSTEQQTTDNNVQVQKQEEQTQVQQEEQKVQGGEQNVYFSTQEQQQYYQQQQLDGQQDGGNFMSYGTEIMNNYSSQQQGGSGDYNNDANVIFNPQQRQGGQQRGGQRQQGNRNNNNKRNNRNKKRGNFNKNNDSNNNEGGYNSVQRNKRWSEEELGSLFGEYFEVMSKFLDGKQTFLDTPLKSLLEQLDAATKTTQPSKIAKTTFTEFRKVAEGICRVLISQNDEQFKEEEPKHFVVLLKELKEVKIQSKSLNEKDLAKELQKLFQSLENVKKIGKFGNNNAPEPSSLGDSCSSILYNLVISIEALQAVLGKKEKFWPKLGGSSSSSSGSSTNTSSTTEKKKKISKPKSKKKKVKKYKKATDLSAKIIEEFGKNERKSDEYVEYYDADDADEVEGDEKSSGDRKPRNNSDRRNNNNKRTTGGNNRQGGRQGGDRKESSNSNNNGGKKNFSGNKRKENNGNKQSGGKPSNRQGGGKKNFQRNNNKGGNKFGNNNNNVQQQQGGNQTDDNVQQLQQQQQQQYQQQMFQQQQQQEQQQQQKEGGQFVTRQPFGPGHHYVINKKVWKNLDLAEKEGTLTIQDKSDKDSQLWKFEHLGIGFYRIIHKPTGKGLTRNEKDEITLEDLNQKKNQNWILVKHFFGRRAYYLIFNAEKTKTLLVDVNTNAVSLQFKNGPSDNDAWKIK